MVTSIPPPDLPHLLPPFLCHIPASFTSAKHPPSLLPLLAPITRSRVTHLSFNNSTSFLSLLNWSSNPSDGERLHDHLTSQDYFFLHQEPSPGTFVFKGARRLDKETIQSLIEVPELGLLIIYQFLAPQEEANEWDNGHEDDENYGWKVLDLRLSDDEDTLGTWCSSIDTAEEEFRAQLDNSINGVPAANFEERQDVDEDEDDYWGRYDDEDTESSVGDRPSTSHTQQSQTSPPTYPSLPTSDTAQINGSLTNEEDEYYSRYADIEPVLDSTTQAAATTTSTTQHTRNLSTTTASSTFSHASHMDVDRSPSPPSQTENSTPLTAHTLPNSSSPTITAAKIERLEKSAELHTQAEIAVQQHLSTSLKSLWRLWKASGGEMEEFERVVEREVEVLKMVEEGDVLT